jgi:hypothetical protein
MIAGKLRRTDGAEADVPKKSNSNKLVSLLKRVSNKSTQFYQRVCSPVCIYGEKIGFLDFYSAIGFN